MRDITNSLKRQLEQAIKKQKANAATLTAGRLMQLSLREHDPELAAYYPPPTPAEAEYLAALERELADAPPDDFIERELERLIREIPNLPDAPSAKIQYGLKEIAPPSTNGHHNGERTEE